MLAGHEHRAIAEIVARALAEDVGDGDVTTTATVPESARARALITQKAPGVVFGLEAAEQTFRSLDPGIAFDALTAEGEWREGGPVAQLEGSARRFSPASGPRSTSSSGCPESPR